MSTVRVEGAGNRIRSGVKRAFAAIKDHKNERLLILGAAFVFVYFVPFSTPRVTAAVNEAFLMLSEYARQHVLFCLVPAFFLAGAMTVFLNQKSVIRYLGPNAAKPVAYAVASVSGSILAFCSCTVLPLFKGIYGKGAGMGPAISFLYSGPAINILAIVLTASVLGLRLGVARAVEAIVFAVVIGGLMHLLHRREDEMRTTNAAMFEAPVERPPRRPSQTAIYMASMIGTSCSSTGLLPAVRWASGIPSTVGSTRSPASSVLFYSTLLSVGFGGTS